MKQTKQSLFLDINRVYNTDCVEGLRLLPANSVDAVVTDPPYEIGFMGKSWDSTGIANNVDLWKECLRVLKPGGYLLSFGGTRTYHRMACAIEDAGFEVRDMIEWVYGSGFPKSLNIGKAVDKLQGNEREDLGLSENTRDRENHIVNAMNKIPNNPIRLTKGTSEYEGWGTALKPAHEPICMARKPLAEKTVAENFLKWGTGGINIDESRVGTEVMQKTTSNGEVLSDNRSMTGANYKRIPNGEAIGRFPANLIHDNSEEVRECFPETGKSLSSKRGADRNGDIYGKYNACDTVRGYDDNGGNASRFFKSIIYTAKASKSERNKGCEGLEEKEKFWHNNEGRDMTNPKNHIRGKVNIQMAQNNHPTVKPIALMEYLITMVTKQGGVVLDPFTGSGTTLVAAKNKSRKYVGFELEKEYCEIANKRLQEGGE